MKVDDLPLGAIIHAIVTTPAGQRDFVGALEQNLRGQPFVLAAGRIIPKTAIILAHLVERPPSSDRSP